MKKKSAWFGLHFGLYSREAFSLLLAAFVVLLVAFLSFRAWTTLVKNANELERTHQIITNTNALLSSLKDAETGQRGFVLTGDDQYLEPYYRALKELPVSTKALERAVSPRPDQAERVNRLKPLVDRKLTELAATIAVRKTGGAEAALAVVRTNQGREFMDETRAICAEIQATANRRLAGYTEQSRGSANALGLTATFGSVLLFAMLLAATNTIQRGIERRQRLIVKLQESEERIGESRDWLQTTLRSIGDGVISTDGDGKVTLLNTVAEFLTGWSQEEATGQDIERIFRIAKEDTGEIVENPLRVALRSGSVVGLANHTELTSREGRQIPIDDSAAPIFDKHGQVKGAVMVFRDVSQRRRAEREIKSGAERVRALLNANPIGVIASDIDGQVHEANPAFLSMTGFTREEVVSGEVNWRAITPPEYLPLDDRALLEAQTRGVCEPYEKEYQRKNGSRFPVYVGFALLDEARTESVSFLLDLTDRKLAEEKLTTQIKRLVNSDIIGIFVSSEEKVLEVNDAFLRILGYTRREFNEGRIDWLNATAAESVARDRTALQQLCDEGSSKPYEKEFLRFDGSRIPVLIGATVLTDKPEMTWISYVVDLSVQKSVEGDLRLANRRLAIANEELQSFAYVVAHDLQSPLRTVSTMTELLMRQLADQVDEDRKRLAAHIKASAKHMANLISDLLDYSKVATDTETTTERVDCGALLEMTLMNLQSQIRATGATVTSGPLPVVLADHQLVQVFQNIIENALKYRSERPPEIHVCSKPSEDGWLFSIRDNGIGFKMDYAERIFGIFHRLHGNAEYEGTGIGLAICRKTIERYGGRIWAESEPGRGSVFYFTLPAATPH